MEYVSVHVLSLCCLCACGDYEGRKQRKWKRCDGNNCGDENNIKENNEKKWMNMNDMR